MGKKKAGFLLILISLLIILYHHTLKYDLIWDTAHFVKNSQLLKDDSSLLEVFTHGYIQGHFGFNRSSFYYRPIVHLTFGLEQRIWGLHSTSLRLTNIVVFWLCLVILFTFFERLKVSEDFPFIVISLFAFLPLNVDNIVWVVSRCDLLLLLWGSLALLFLQSYVQGGNKRHLFYSSLFVLLGIFSKETFLFFVPFFLLFEYLSRRKITLSYHLANGAVIGFFFLVKNLLLQIGTLQFMFSPRLLENLDIIFSVTGYYFRILLFPVNFVPINFVRQILAVQWLLLALACLAVMLAAGIKWRKDKQVLLSFALIILFLIPFVMLAFSDLWPFRISSRYMMGSALGVLWFFSRLIDRLQRKLKWVVVPLLILMFVPSILNLSRSYRSEVQFWQRAHADHPDQASILYLLALAHYQQDDELSAYSCLTEALKKPVPPFTGRAIRLLLANMEYRRARYQSVFSLLDHMPGGPTPRQEYQMNILRAKVAASRGDWQGAEKILFQLTAQFKENRQGYNKLFQLYVGFNLWSRAAALEQQYKVRFNQSFALSSRQVKQRLDRSTRRQKVLFFASYQNYRAAIEGLTALPSPTLKDRLQLIEMYYRYDKPRLAEQSVARLLADHPGSSALVKSLGLFYLHRLKRVNQALIHLQRSLQLQPRQPQLAKMVAYLKSIAATIQ